MDHNEDSCDSVTSHVTSSTEVESENGGEEMTARNVEASASQQDENYDTDDTEILLE